MEGLRHLASHIEANELKFRPSPVKLQLVEIDAHHYEEDSIQHDQVEQLVDRVSLRRTLSDDAHLILVCIIRSNYGEPFVTKDHFDAIWDALGLNIEPYLRYLIARVPYGFTHFKDICNDKIDLYAFGHVQYLLIWRYDIRTSQTRAMILPRKSTSRGHGLEAYEDFRRLLSDNRSHFKSPHVLALSAAANCLETAEWTVGNQITVLRRLESSTGFGVWGVSWHSETFTTPDVMKMSRDLSNIQVEVANNTRLLSNLDVMLAFLIEQHQQWEHETADNPQARLKPEGPSLSTRNSVVAASQILKQQVAHAKTAHAYLEARSRSQSTVLFSLLTHEDSEINKGIAKATQEDGSAMKTIAVMTMAFLPGTFFAALFSVPLLQWTNPDHVIQSNFWVYWAFTIPATIIVFVFWIFMTRYSNLYDLVMGHVRGQQSVVQSEKKRL